MGQEIRQSNERAAKKYYNDQYDKYMGGSNFDYNEVFLNKDSNSKELNQQAWDAASSARKQKDDESKPAKPPGEAFADLGDLGDRGRRVSIMDEQSTKARRKSLLGG